MRINKSIQELLDDWKIDANRASTIEHVHVTKPKEAIYAPFPEQMHPSIQKALKSRGVHQLYIHQRHAFDAATSGKSYTTITPTASGKSLCYHLPVLQSITGRPNFARYLFIPNKSISTRSKK